MDERLRRIEQLQSILHTQIKTACRELTDGVTTEIQSIHQHVSKQSQHHPSCTIKEHTIKLQDYEDLKAQHKLTLESCSLLRIQNARLLTGLNELSPRDSDTGAVRSSDAVATTNESTSDNSTTLLSAEQLIQSNAELQNMFESQADDYMKLQRAHSVLLTKLRQHQQVIVEMQKERRATLVTSRDADEKRLAELRTAINPTRTISRSPASPNLENLPRQSSLSTPRHGEVRLASPEIVLPSKAASARSKTTSTASMHGTDREHKTTHGAMDNEVILIDSSGSERMAVQDLPVLPPPIIESQPVFVSERPVKRRRMDKAASGQSAHKYIKTEPSTSNILASDEGQASIDLDAVYTPIISKGRRSEEYRRPVQDIDFQQTESTSTQRHSAPPRNTTAISDQIPPAIPVRVPEPEMTIKNEQSAVVQDSVVEVQPQVTVEPDRRAMNQDTPRRAVLQPKTPNSRLIAKNHDKSILTTSTALKKGMFDVVDHTDTAVLATPASSLARKRLSPSKCSKGKGSTPTMKPVQKYQTPLQRKRDHPESRLRDRDIEELTVGDFKLNPAMNQAFNEAFGFSNPNKESRNCPPNCSNVECCGSAFAVAIRESGMASLQDMSQGRKDTMITTYIGFPVSSLETLSKQAYSKLLGEAIGKEFADKYGKQKQSRADSPPGYWRVDFPTTQEVAADRRVAEDRERCVIEERRREALRENGLWIFRDE